MSLSEPAGASAFAGREYPERPFPSVAVFIFKDSKVLLIKRANPPSQGLWSVPGGVVELGETIQDAAHREVGEECGIEIEVGEVFNAENLIFRDETGRVRFHYVVTYVLAKHTGGEPRPVSEALDVRWVSLQELAGLEMNPVLHRNLLRAFDVARTAG